MPTPADLRTVNASTPSKAPTTMVESGIVASDGPAQYRNGDAGFEVPVGRFLINDMATPFSIAMRRYCSVNFRLSRAAVASAINRDPGILAGRMLPASALTGLLFSQLAQFADALPQMDDAARQVALDAATDFALAVLRLETRSPNIEGRGEITQRTLVRNALRMRPDRIILGEVRGAEALDMLNAMNTGHEGSLSTIHANTPRDAVARMETMITMAGFELPLKALRQQIASAVDLVVQANRLQGGPRKITQITEILGMEQDTIVMQDIYHFTRLGVDENGRAHGRFEATGVRPNFMDRLEAAGVRLPASAFRQRVMMED